MSWIELFAVFAVSHLMGDFVLQTYWQATKKRGGLGSSSESRRALGSHIASYMLSFGPALIWLAADRGAPTAAAAVAIVAVPHAIQDDYRLLEAFAVRVKRMQPSEYPVVMLLLDQSFHIIALFLAALALAA